MKHKTVELVFSAACVRACVCVCVCVVWMILLYLLLSYWAFFFLIVDRYVYKITAVSCNASLCKCSDDMIQPSKGTNSEGGMEKGCSWHSTDMAWGGRKKG